MSMRVLSYTEACFLRLIVDELDRARALHPNWPRDTIHQASIVAEEAGEVVQAALQREYEAGGLQPVMMELIQAGAMCMRMYCGIEEEEQLNEQRQSAWDLLLDARPCPFCTSGDTHLNTNDRKHPSWWLSCSSCQAEGPKCGSAEAALSRWNERYDDDGEEI